MHVCIHVGTHMPKCQKHYTMSYMNQSSYLVAHTKARVLFLDLSLVGEFDCLIAPALHAGKSTFLSHALNVTYSD